MRQLHFDIISGIAGDMAMGALLHLGAPLGPLLEALQAMGLAQATAAASEVRIHGIGAMRFSVSVPAAEQHHRAYAEIRALLQRAGMTPAARDRAEAVFAKLAEAEGRIHGVAVEAVTFHEVGAIDSIADIVGCALALEHFRPGRVTSSPPLTGHGLTPSRHGLLPVPAPATVEILKGIRLRTVDLEAELTTPTGAALLATQVQQFTSTPDLVVQGVGYGAGTRELRERPNILRVILGEATSEWDEEVLIESNLDDMNPAHFEHLMDGLFEAGAADVWLLPAIMKKSRPAVLLGVLCKLALAPALERIVFTESTTIGLRRTAISRRKLSRRFETVNTPFGPVRLKIAFEGDEIFSISPEYEDCRARAKEHGVALKTVSQAARAAWDGHQGEKP